MNCFSQQAGPFMRNVVGTPQARSSCSTSTWRLIARPGDRAFVGRSDAAVRMSETRMATLVAPFPSVSIMKPSTTVSSVTPDRGAEPGPRGAFHAFFADVAERLSVREAMLSSTLPGDRLQLLQRGGDGTGGSKATNDTIESIAWRAILEGKAIESDPNGESILALRIAEPVLPGYAGALVLRMARGATNGDDVLAQAGNALRIAMPGSAGETPSRQFFFRADGSVIGSGHDSAVLIAARRALADIDQLSDGPNRILIAMQDGHHAPAVVAKVDSDSALGRLGVAAVVSLYPGGEDWARLTPQHFAADEELSRLARAIEFMAHDYHKGPTLEDVAGAVRLSQFHFHRRFTERFGITPKHLLFDFQLDRAKQMLADPRIAMSDIAAACGFAHQSHFTSRFKQGTAQTPSAWRRQALKRV